MTGLDVALFVGFVSIGIGGFVAIQRIKKAIRHRALLKRLNARRRDGY
jgi:hypothetical protein